MADGFNSPRTSDRYPGLYFPRALGLAAVSWVVPGSRLLNGTQIMAPYKAAPLPGLVALGYFETTNRADACSQNRRTQRPRTRTKRLLGQADEIEEKTRPEIEHAAPSVTNLLIAGGG